MKWFAQKPKPIVITNPSPEIDTDSDTWLAVTAKVRDERAKLLEENASIRRDAIETAVLRGRIKQCEWFLKMNETRGITL